MIRSLHPASPHRIVFAGLLWLVVLTVAGIPGAAASRKPCRCLTPVDGTITPVMRNYIHRGISDAEKSNASAVVLRMDTPGGLSSATDDIIQDILNSKVPVIVYVDPPGARAASSRCVHHFYAAHIAAMAPSTNIGSATPIFLDQGGQVTTADDTLTRKVVNDAVARIRDCATLQGRNAD